MTPPPGALYTNKLGEREVESSWRWSSFQGWSLTIGWEPLPPCRLLRPSLCTWAFPLFTAQGRWSYNRPFKRWVYALFWERVAVRVRMVFISNNWRGILMHQSMSYLSLVCESYEGSMYYYSSLPLKYAVWTRAVGAHLVARCVLYSYHFLDPLVQWIATGNGWNLRQPARPKPNNVKLLQSWASRTRQASRRGARECEVREGAIRKV